MTKKDAKAESSASTSTSDTAPTPSDVVTPMKSASGAGNSSSLLFLVLPIMVALAGGLYATFVMPLSDSTHVVNPTLAPTNATEPLAVPEFEIARPEVDRVETARVGREIDDKYPPLYDKYESDFVHITTQKLLTPAPEGDACRAFEIVGELTSVKDAMAKSTVQLRDEGVVFLMLNGENDGLFLKWDVADNCLRELALRAGEQLGADVDVLQNGVKLMTQMGLPITTAAELDAAGRIAHVLLDFQTWVWPGIEVGHVFDVDGVTVKTLSMKPRVFGVEGFFTEEEADEIMRQGINRLERSFVVESPDAVDGYHPGRTSYTAFLKDNQFTRDIRVRTAKLTRLPSPSFAERLQLVRYETGQFYRQHEDYFEPNFLPFEDVAAEDYHTWVEWASAKLSELQSAGVEIPQQFQAGQAMHPNADDTVTFEHAILKAFLEDADATDYFREHADVDWGTWIRNSLNDGASNVMETLLRDKGHMLPHIIKSWEKRVALPQLKYKIPKRPVSGVSHYFRWLRWVKERVQNLMDENPDFVPEEFRPTGRSYPTYNKRFQNILVDYILEDYDEKSLTETLNAEWYTWLTEHRNDTDVLWQGLKVTPKIFELALAAFTKRAGDKFTYEMPLHLQHFEPNRFVTVFLYLNECPEGGETVFPYSKDRLATDIKREGMEECSEGLAVPPTKLTAAMFYAQTPENFPDPASLHGGCPPARGTKYGANLFTWNADADEGGNACYSGWDFKYNPRADEED